MNVETSEVLHPVPTGVDALHTLLARIATLETRVQELERIAHHEHTIDGEALKQITDIVLSNIAQKLVPIVPAETDK